MRHISLIIAVLALAVAAPAIAGKGGNGNGNGGGGGNSGGNAGSQQANPTCSVDPASVDVGQTYVVSASGLPTETAINLWVTDSDGVTAGSPLGSTPDGTFALNESSSSAGTWTYTFSGPTKNNAGSTAVYATCSVDAY
jgi:hypothetical protein